MLEEIVKSSVGLIWEISKKFYGVPKDDLYQAGVLGVIKAYQNFDSNGDAKFSSYAYMYIYGEMYNVSINKEIKLSKDIVSLLKKIEVGRMRLAQEIMKEPTTLELAKYLEIDQSVLEQVMQYSNTLVSMDDESEDMRNLHEVISNDSDVSIDDKLLLNQSMESLDELERNIINHRYFDDLTQSETAKILGISQVKVSRYETRSLKKMKDFMYM